MKFSSYFATIKDFWRYKNLDVNTKFSNWLLREMYFGCCFGTYGTVLKLFCLQRKKVNDIAILLCFLFTKLFLFVCLGSFYDFMGFKEFCFFLGGGWSYYFVTLFCTLISLQCCARGRWKSNQKFTPGTTFVAVSNWQNFFFK